MPPAANAVVTEVERILGASNFFQRLGLPLGRVEAVEVRKR